MIKKDPFTLFVHVDLLLFFWGTSDQLPRLASPAAEKQVSISERDLKKNLESVNSQSAVSIADQLKCWFEQNRKRSLVPHTHVLQLKMPPKNNSKHAGCKYFLQQVSFPREAFHQIQRLALCRVPGRSVCGKRVQAEGCGEETQHHQHGREAILAFIAELLDFFFFF